MTMSKTAGNDEGRGGIMLVATINGSDANEQMNERRCSVRSDGSALLAEQVAELGPADQTISSSVRAPTSSVRAAHLVWRGASGNWQPSTHTLPAIDPTGGNGPPRRYVRVPSL